MVKEGPDGTVLLERLPFAWVDTNVIAEIYSFGDIVHAKRHESAERLEERRVRMQGSLWMATVLFLGNAVTLSYEHEVARTIIKQCPPGSDLFEWGRIVVYLFLDAGLLAGWEQVFPTAGHDIPGSGARDTFMAEACANMRLKLFARDDGALRKARARGVDAVEPQQFAERLMPRSLAERYFMHRLDAALTVCAEKGPIRDPRSLKAVRAVYEYIWAPAGAAEPFSAEAMFR